ncbi:Meiosis mei2 [Fusarium agapanthi]|uniref:Meiosis mei2 n=1 Tax=Fusarium agapanthi TaxID=1803897 RepID=A0A9P5B9P0_9HYPO|nr:Meiosis mei2 [Fusarium agapanthi]
MGGGGLTPSPGSALSHRGSVTCRHPVSYHHRTLEKLKFKIRRRLRKDAKAANVEHEALGLVSLERVCKELTQKGVGFHGGRNLETTGGHVYVVFEDLRDAALALVALESQLVRLCEICTVCLGVNGVHVNAYSVELAHSFELRLQRNQDFDGLRTLDTNYTPHTHTHTHTLSLSLSLSTTIMGTPGRIGLDLDLDRILGYNTQLNQTLEPHLDFYLDTHKLVQLVNASMKAL